jgi:hypothetical protein
MAREWDGAQPGEDGGSGYAAIPGAPLAGQPREPGIEAGGDDLTPHHRPDEGRSFWRRRPQ